MRRKAEEQKGIEHYMQLPYSILLHQVEDAGERYWMAEYPELPGCRSHGSTIEEAVTSAEEAKKDWLLDSLDSGEEIPTPVERDRFSGKTLVRMSRSLHRALALMAEIEKLSLNQLIVTTLAKEVGRLGVLNRVEGKLDELLEKIDSVAGQQALAVSPVNDSVTFTAELQEQAYLAEPSNLFRMGVANAGAFRPELIGWSPGAVGVGTALTIRGAEIRFHAAQRETGIPRVLYAWDQDEEKEVGRKTELPAE